MKKKNTAPEELSGDALLAWDTFNGSAIDAADRPAMIVLCKRWGEMLQAERHIEKNGTVIKLPNGYPGPNPYCKIRDTAEAVVVRLLREFGYTPQSRAKIMAGKADAEQAAELEF